MLHSWRPAADFPADHDYLSQLAAYRGRLVPSADFDWITGLCRTAMPPTQLEHGDAHLGNAIDTPAG